MYRLFGKRLADIILSTMGLLLLSVIFIPIALLIYIEDRGPIFYIANRLGKGGNIFKMYKFRSMKVNAPDIRNEDGSTFNSDEDPRMTRIGKFLRKTSLDEAPQVINVFIGNMSVIGPRPDLPEHMSCYVDNEIKKLNVLPGISGYNQAYFRNEVEWKQRLIHDVYYVDNLTMWLDIKIFFKTISGILLSRGVFTNNSSKSTGGTVLNAKRGSNNKQAM